jgi:hypothetical protein
MPVKAGKADLFFPLTLPTILICTPNRQEQNQVQDLCEERRENSARRTYSEAHSFRHGVHLGLAQERKASLCEFGPLDVQDQRVLW